MNIVSTRANIRPPGPKSRPLVGNSLQFAMDPLGFPRRCLAEFGEIVYLNVRGLKTYLVVAPEAIEDVLATKRDNFILDRLSRSLSDALGNSLLVSDGELWERQRRLVQPAFHKSRIEAYAATMIHLSNQLTARWADGAVVDIFQEMSRLMLDIVINTLLGSDAIGERGVIEDFLNLAMRHVLGIAKTGLRLPLYVPSPGNIACLRAGKALEKILYGLIREQRSQNRDSGDLLSMLLLARDEDGGSISDQQIRDEIVTMILVGHETSALALTYALWLLATHPAAFQQLRAEIDAVLGDKDITFEDLPRLHYCEWVFNEALRLYPPVWAMGREALAACEVGGYAVPAGAQILLSPWVSHRNPRYFDAPDQFLPERWETADKLPRYAYFPFGGGARLCLGNRYARMEALIILATVARSFVFSAAPDQRLELSPSVTLRPRHAVNLRIKAQRSEGKAYEQDTR